jgi:hypothetical protein
MIVELAAGIDPAGAVHTELIRLAEETQSCRRVDVDFLEIGIPGKLAISKRSPGGNLPIT